MLVRATDRSRAAVVEISGCLGTMGSISVEVINVRNFVAYRLDVNVITFRRVVISGSERHATRGLVVRSSGRLSLEGSDGRFLGLFFYPRCV